MAERRFCRDLCLARGEPVSGLGPSSRSYVLLHWPRAHWRVPRFRSHLMPDFLGKAIQTANAAGIHVALVDGDHIGFTHEGIIRRSVTAEQAESLLLHIADGGRLDGERDERVTIICCTDAKQDPCCARYGFATWKALRQAADPDRFRILQSTHLGGCRFAASLLVLPQRARYGRLEPFEVEDFLGCVGAGVAYLPAYRGNPLLDAPRQAAEHAALSWAAQNGVSGEVSFRDVAEPPSRENSLAYALAVGGYRLTVTVEQSAFAVNTRCTTIESGGDPAQVMRWIATAVVADSRETQ